MRAALRQQIRDRAGGRCEYCRLPETASDFRFVPDHIVARQHLGEDDLSNLAWACPSCNRRKGPNIAGVDPISVQPAYLFNARTQLWSEHFAFEGSVVVGLTPAGRATVVTLGLNLPLQQQVRRALLLEGLM